jgi:hypothetical protein
MQKPGERNLGGRRALVDPRADVGVGGVDEVDAQLHRTAQNPQGVLALHPRARTAQAHGAEAESTHLEVPFDSERLRRRAHSPRPRGPTSPQSDLQRVASSAKRSPDKEASWSWFGPQLFHISSRNAPAERPVSAALSLVRCA